MTSWRKARVRAALADAGADLAAVRQMYAGYVYGDSTSGQNVVYRAGMTGVPVINVNNNCPTGSSALFLARQADDVFAHSMLSMAYLGRRLTNWVPKSAFGPGGSASRR
jgi:hypothetical protein